RRRPGEELPGYHEGRHDLQEPAAVRQAGAGLASAACPVARSSGADIMRMRMVLTAAAVPGEVTTRAVGDQPCAARARALNRSTGSKRSFPAAFARCAGGG